MATVREPSTLNSDIVYHVGRVLPWLAETAGQSDMSWFTTRNLAHTASSKIEAAVLSLAHELRERREAVTTAISRMTSKLKSEVESTKPGTIMDPDGTATLALEQAEEYFRMECEALDSIRAALKASGDAAIHDSRIFDELEELHRLFASVVSWSQEVRWLMLINDGTLAPTTGKTFTSGADLISALDAMKRLSPPMKRQFANVRIRVTPNQLQLL